MSADNRSIHQHIKLRCISALKLDFLRLFFSFKYDLPVNATRMIVDVDRTNLFLLLLAFCLT